MSDYFENNLPFVSIVIPCRNEEKFISRCLDSIVASGYPRNKLEVLVIDGMSEDKTRKIVTEYTRQYHFIRLLNNLKKITPVALNLGIRNANGEIIVRMDAHAEYPVSYVSKCTEYLNITNADVVGGPIITIPSKDTFIAKCIALIISHPFGVGNSRFRTSIKKGYVDTVPFGAYRRDVFDKVGLFDERLVRNQDNEMSSRIIKNGGRIYFDPDLKVRYYNQSTISGLLRQAFRTGIWNIITVKINPSAFHGRHFVPLLFVTALLTSGLLALFHFWSFLVFLLLVCLYGVAAAVSSFHIGIRMGIRYAVFLPVIFFFYHVSYGMGSLIGILRIFRYRR